MPEDQGRLAGERDGGLRCRPPPQCLCLLQPAPPAPQWTQELTETHAHEPTGTSNMPEAPSRHRSQLHSGDSGPVATYLYNFRQKSPLQSELLCGPVSLMTCPHLQDASKTQPLLTTSTLPAWSKLPSPITWISTTDSLLIFLLPSFVSYCLFTHQPDGSFST